MTTNFVSIVINSVEILLELVGFQTGMFVISS